MSSQTNNTDGNPLVCVKRSETTIATIFEDMYLNERLVDVTVSCSNGQLQAHKLVLAACSPYFSNLFENLPNVFHYPVVVIKDMHIDDLKLILEFMYKGQLIVERNRLAELIKCAQNLEITGLSDLDSSTLDTPMNELVTIVVDVPRNASSIPSKVLKRTKRTVSTSSNQFGMDRPYHSASNKYNPFPDKFLDQSILSGESPYGNGSLDFGNYAHDSNATRNFLTAGQQNQSMSRPTSSIQLQQSMTGNQQLQNQTQDLSSQLQMLSHSLGPNRTASSSPGNVPATNGNGSLSQQSASQHRGRVHPCNICWKTFRERANLKRHLQVHSLDRTMYACLDCNKTFSWKDNYIRHTKTAHHINNARQRT